MGFLTLEEIDSNLIDNRNRALWNKLNANYQISVSDHHDGYTIDYLSGSDEVYIETTRNYSPAFFTHELLHLNLRYKGLNVFESFKRTNDFSTEVFTCTISNCIEHVLFFDEYIEMGYDKEDFVIDYNNHPFGISGLKQQFNQLYDTTDPTVTNLFNSFCYWILRSGKQIGEDRENDLEVLRNEFPLKYQEMEKMFSEVLNFTFDSENVQGDFNNLISRYIEQNSYY